jgi:hypothetical protein
MNDRMGDDEKSLSFAQLNLFASNFKGTFSVQNVMDFVVVPHGRTKVVTGCASFCAVMKELQLLKVIIFAQICNQGYSLLL